jgi:hypothetical protein
VFDDFVETLCFLSCYFPRERNNNQLLPRLRTRSWLDVVYRKHAAVPRALFEPRYVVLAQAYRSQMPLWSSKAD